MARDRNPYRKRRRGPGRSAFLGLLGLVLLALGFAAYLRFGPAPSERTASSGEEVTAATAPPAASPSPAEPGAEASPEVRATASPLVLALPPLDESDALVREQAGRLSSHRAFSAWLASRDLVRRFVVAVDNVANGVSPKKQLEMLEPRAPFRTRERDGRVYLDPASYARYDLAADVVASLDAAATARLYGAARPLLDAAYTELGYPDRRFDDTLRRAIERLLATPLLEGPVELVPRVISYAFADPELEGSSPAQKQFLRMGPRNVRRVQAKLGELAAALGPGESEPPREPVRGAGSGG